MIHQLVEALSRAQIPDSGYIGDPNAGGTLFVWGPTLPTGAGYKTGCLFLHTDGGDGTALYVNEGTEATADFNAIIVA